MAFLETISHRLIKEGECPVKITLAGTVYAGDPVGYDSGWKLAASATVIFPVLIAGQDGVSGDVITAYPIAVVEVVTTLSNAATVGQVVGVTDGGLYSAEGAGLPDVGIVVAKGADSLTAVLFLLPAIVELTVPRT
jgi:hypothetical protein